MCLCYNKIKYINKIFQDINIIYLFDQKYSVICNIVKYYYNSK